MKILLQDYYMNGKGKSKVLIKFLLNFRQSGDVLFFLNARRLRGYTATGGFFSLIWVIVFSDCSSPIFTERRRFVIQVPKSTN